MSLLVIALYLLDWKGLKAAVLRVNIWQFSLATGISLFIFSLMSLRWYELIRKVPLSRIHHSRHYFYSIFLNIMTPANIGGDVYRFLALKDHKADKSFVAVALVRERLAGLLAYLLTFLICYSGLWIFNPAFRGLSFLFFAFSVILASVILIVLSPYIIRQISALNMVRSRAKLAGLIDKLQGVFHFDSAGSVVVIAGLSLLGSFLWIAAVKVVAVDLDIHLSFTAIGVVVVLVELIRLIPISIQGIGVREGMFAYFCGKLGTSPEAGFILGTVSYLALSLSIVIAGFFGLCLMHLYPLDKEG